MLFNSFEFLVFFLLVLLLYYTIPNKYRWALILFASCIFYMDYKPIYILVLFAIILIDYGAALLIEKSAGTKTRNLLLLISLLSNIGILAYFKYYNFIFENVSLVLSEVGIRKEFRLHELVLPIGLSFHTFQSMAYTIEVAKGRQKAERHLGYFAEYVLFFPQMVAGPIEKYSSLGTQLKNKVVFEYENFSNGFRLMLYGLFIKVVVADSISYIPDEVFQNPEDYSFYDTWIGVLTFSIQIYADFFGYSIIAVGAARCLGIRLMDNFNNPYFSHDLIEFWKRWHISLTSWFREYVYFSLGGNKVSVIRWLVNILLVFTLSGIWHGASWTFVWWGLAHGLLYLIEKPFDRIKIRNKIILFFSIVLNFIIVSLLWILFRAPDMKTVKIIFSRLFHITSCTKSLDIPYEIPVILVLFFMLELLFRESRIDRFLSDKNVWIRWTIYTGLLFAILFWSDINTTPFIYFKF